MALTQLAPPYPIFTDKSGDPLDNGYLYFGEVNKNPETNPIQVYYDSAFTQPAAQPLRTSNGYVMRNGSPALIYADSQFSVTIRDKNSALVIYSPVGYGVDPASISGSVSVQDHTGDGTTTAFGMGASPSTINATNVYIDGVYQEKDTYTVSGTTLTFSEAPPLNAGIEIVVQESSILGGATAGQISYNEGSVGAVNTTVKAKLQETVSVKDFGAVGDGVTDDTAAVQAALATGKNISLANGTYLVNDQLSATSSIIDGNFVLGSSVPSGYFLTFNASDIELRNVGFTANATPSNGATYFQTGSNISVQNCRFENFDRDGIAVSNLVTHIRIINNYLNNCKGDPAGAQYGSINCNASHSIIANNNIDYCKQTGISVNGVFKVVIQGNNINGRGLFVSGGVVVDGFCNFISIDGNVIDDMVVEGINIAGSLTAYGGVTESISVTNNVCRKCYYTSLSLYSVDANYSVRDVNVTGNTFSYEGGGIVGAVLLDGCKDVNLSANTIVGYPSAVNVLNTGGNSPVNTNIVGNTIKAQSSFGVFASNDMNIGSNIFIGSGGSTRAITGDAAAIGGKVLISNNFITGWGTGLELTFTPTNTIYVRDNLLKDNTTDLDYTGAAGNSSLDNVFTGLVLSGSFTLSSGTATVANVNVQAGERIRLFRTAVGGTAGAAYVSQVNAGTQFIVTSTSATDTSTFSYEFVR